MIKKETVLYYAKCDEDKLFLSRIYDNYAKTYMKNYNTYSDFYGEEKTELIKNAFSTERDISLNTYGGYEGAERMISAFLVNENTSCYPISCLEVRGRNLKDLSHRDFLGALMGLGIKRETVGDIVISDRCCIFVKSEIAEYIINNLNKVGKHGVSVEYYTGDSIEKEEKFEIVSTSVASLRLDLILAAGFNLKRSTASSLILSGRVNVSYRTVENSDYRVKENEKISVKGYGKIIYLGQKGTSKKGKIIVNIKKLI